MEEKPPEEDEIKLQWLIMQMTEFQTKFKTMERELCLITTKHDQKFCYCIKGGTVSGRLAENVDTVAGLKQAIRSNNRFWTWFWIFLLCIGVGGTTFYIFETVNEYLEYPTKTNVKLQRQTSYEYPPMAFCPEVWLDANKVLSMGLSTEAFLYSIGYIDYYHNFIIKNITEARREFYEKYEINKFNTLIDYYKSIALDLESASTNEKFKTTTNPGYYFFGYNSPVEKVFMSEGICYKFKFADVQTGFGNTVPYVVFKFPQAHKEIFSSTPFAGKLFFLQESEYFDPSLTPGVALHSFYIESPILTPKKISSLHTKENPCVTQEKSRDVSYSTLRCMAECENQAYKEKYNCYKRIITGNRNLSEFCHFDDAVGNGTFLREYLKYRFLASQEYSCSEKCPNMCERTVYDVSLMYGYEQQGTRYGRYAATVTSLNMSLYYARVAHSGVLHDGVMIFNETYAYSSIMLVNNIGGTLGLFIGATLMTIVQIFVFAFRIFVERFRKMCKKT